ncbi:MAG TPA: RNA methyltransferase [Thermoanaerobaculia bacterium]|nr:RNA methyltransferase [Thermoanaerobaculia bacterium]
MAGKVQNADAGEEDEEAPRLAAKPSRQRSPLIGRGYSMTRVVAIESPANPLVKEIARALEERTHFLLEGEKAILDAVTAGLTLDHVLHDEAVRPGRLAALASARPRLVSRSVLERLAESKTPQHLLAVARRRDVPVGEILDRPGPVVFLFGIQDPGNLGAVVRVGEAAGCGGVVAAAGSADFFHPRAVRASAGSVLRIPVSGRVAFEAFASDARRAGREICGAIPSSGEDVFRSPISASSVVVIGSEGSGLPAGAYRYLDRKLTIPMRPPVDSLNAAVAAALLLYSPMVRTESKV